jgi:radical SAM superfamily enzyme YgiQ (UPF0313 family)
MKLLLISPTDKVGRKVFRVTTVPKLALHILASLTPPEVTLTVVDEQTGKIDPSQDFDLVGITAITVTANRAYELADKYRERGSKVVLGGVHPTILPQEALQHADAIVLGEAEGCWAEVLADFKRNSLQTFYRSPAPDLSRYPSPRRDLQIGRVLFGCVPLITTRGCPYSCEFCSATALYGSKIRHKPIAKVVEDILLSGSKTFLILDDNVAGDPDYSKELFRALIPLGITWTGQSSMSIARDRELLRLCRLSGCVALLFGVESVSPASLSNLKKSLRSLQETEEAVKIVQDQGIAFHPSIILGFDTDTKAVFDDTLDFLARTRLPTVALHVLTPYPGTAVHQRFKDEGRIISYNWSHYDNTTVVFRPKNMTPDELTEGYHYVRRSFYSLSSIVGRIPYLLRVFPIDFRRAAVLLLLNLAARAVKKRVDTSS